MTSAPILAMRSIGSVLGASLFFWGCAAGTFSRVPMPVTTSEEEAGVAAQLSPMGTAELMKLLDRNYYRLLYQEEPTRPEPCEAFIDRMMAAEVVSPVAVMTLGPSQSGVIASALEHIRTPLVRRMTRVAERVTEAAGRRDLIFTLNPSMGLNAGALMGLNSHRIEVGPQLVLLAETDDELAFVLGPKLVI